MLSFGSSASPVFLSVFGHGRGLLLLSGRHCRVLLIAQADTYLRALGSRVAERPAAELPLLLTE